VKFQCRINGQVIDADIAPRMLLSDFIRHELRLTGTNIGCEMGVCGACTVIVDGEPTRSCLMFAVQTDGCHVETVESLASNGKLNPLQQAFHEHHALQCGYCTPGFLMTVEALSRKNALPSNEDAVRQAISGNICRCTGYQNIVDAIMSLSQ
jgi:aerobic-type carbon monoxide dehydrogenase small subunit (CoxS/CutS family)